MEYLSGVSATKIKIHGISKIEYFHVQNFQNGSKFRKFSSLKNDQNKTKTWSLTPDQKFFDRICNPRSRVIMCF